MIVLVVVSFSLASGMVFMGFSSKKDNAPWVSSFPVTTNQNAKLRCFPADLCAFNRVIKQHREGDLQNR